MTSPSLGVGEIVVLSKLDCEPLVLVIATDDATSEITGILLADLDSERIQRLKQSIGNREHRRKETAEIKSAANCETYSIPYAEVAHRRALDLDGCPPPPLSDGPDTAPTQRHQ